MSAISIGNFNSVQLFVSEGPQPATSLELPFFLWLIIFALETIFLKQWVQLFPASIRRFETPWPSFTTASDVLWSNLTCKRVEFHCVSSHVNKKQLKSSVSLCCTKKMCLLTSHRLFSYWYAFIHYHRSPIECYNRLRIYVRGNRTAMCNVKPVIRYLVS